MGFFDNLRDSIGYAFPGAGILNAGGLSYEDQGKIGAIGGGAAMLAGTAAGATAAGGAGAGQVSALGGGGSSVN